MKLLAIICFLVPFTVVAQERADGGKPEVTSEIVPAARAQELLKALIPKKSKSVTLTATATFTTSTNG